MCFVVTSLRSLAWYNDVIILNVLLTVEVLILGQCFYWDILFDSHTLYCIDVIPTEYTTKIEQDIKRVDVITDKLFTSVCLTILG